LTFSPDSKRLAVGYNDVVAVDILDATTLRRLGGHNPTNARMSPVGLARVAWSRDNKTLFAAGAIRDAANRRLLFAWDSAGLGEARRMTNCGDDTARGIDALESGDILVASGLPCLGLIHPGGLSVWSVSSPILDFRASGEERSVISVSPDGKVVDFGDWRFPSRFRFDTRALTLSTAPPDDDLTRPPHREGLTIEGWAVGQHPTLGGNALPLATNDWSRSLAVAPDAKSFYLGTEYSLTAFDATGAEKWRSLTSVVWAVNASQDGRLVVAAFGDGTIRWRRADNGAELLALQVLPNKGDVTKWDWVLWTPEGFYEATPGAQDVLRWVVNHGPDRAPTTLPVSAIAKLHRPKALPLVLDNLETARALGIEDMSAARLDVQTKTQSEKPPGAVLHVLTIGVDKFGDKAGGLRLDYAADDARDVANALRESQKLAPGKPSLYADVKVESLIDEQADNNAISDALDRMAASMAKSDSNQDVALILVSSHGEMIQGKFYLIPYGFDLGSENASRHSALPASEFAEKIAAIAARGKVLLLLDACHSGAVGPSGWVTTPDVKALQDTMNLKNVTVLTSSNEKELSRELVEWGHGALSQAFLDALRAAGDSDGVVKLSAIVGAMANEVKSLTRDKQHLGMHMNYDADMFIANQM
jgi:Caspase domain